MQNPLVNISSGHILKETLYLITQDYNNAFQSVYWANFNSSSRTWRRLIFVKNTKSALLWTLLLNLNYWNRRRQEQTWMQNAIVGNSPRMSQMLNQAKWLSVQAKLQTHIIWTNTVKSKTGSPWCLHTVRWNTSVCGVKIKLCAQLILWASFLLCTLLFRAMLISTYCWTLQF